MKLTVASLSLAVLGTTAFAQPAAKPATPATPAKAAQPAQPTKVAPPADSKAPVAPPQPTAPPKPPTPAQEMVDLAKVMNGTWKCTGKADVAGTMFDLKATMTHKVDANLNKFWITSNFVGTIPKMPPLKFTMFTGWDPNTKKLFRVSVSGMGGHMVSTATYDAKKITYEGESSNMNGVVRMRHTEEVISPKEVHVSGELSKDNGKTWVADHDATCKK
jgi:hypothetical protein